MRRSVRKHLGRILLLALGGAILLASCTFSSQSPQGEVATTIGIPPEVGPELVGIPVGDMTVVMQPGSATQAEVETVLGGVNGYLEGTGEHVAIYMGASQVDIYRFLAVDRMPGPVGHEGPMTCITEVERGRLVQGWGCSGGINAIEESGILGMGSSESQHGDYTATIEVGSRVEVVAIETDSGFTIVIHPAGGVAYAEWRHHRPTRITAFHDDGSSVSEVMW